MVVCKGKRNKPPKHGLALHGVREAALHWNDPYGSTNSSMVFCCNAPQRRKVLICEASARFDCSNNHGIYPKFICATSWARLEIQITVPKEFQVGSSPSNDALADADHYSLVKFLY